MRWRRLSTEDYEELRTWWAITWPTGTSSALMLAMDFTDAAMLGHFHKGDLLPAASSALLIISLTVAIMGRGPSGAALTLSANAFGAGQSELAGRRLVLSLTVTLLLSLCVAPVWYAAGDLLKAISSSSPEPHDVNTFARWRLLGLPPMAMFWILKSWLTGRKVTTPGMYAALLGAFLNLLLNTVLIFGCWRWEGLGFIGSPIATSLSRWAMFVGLAAGGRSEVRCCWPSRVRASFSLSRFKDFLALCAPLTLSGLVEDINLQLTALFALHFGPQVLATHNCMMTAFLLLSSVMMGCTDGVSTRVSHHIVRGDITKMRRLCALAFRVMLSWSFVVMLAFTCLQNKVGMLFSENQVVWRLSGQVSFLLGFANFAMTFFYVAFGILKGLAKPTIVVFGFVLGCYAVGLPLTYYFGFKVPAQAFAWWPYFDIRMDAGPGSAGCGALGLWLGLASGYLATTSVVVGRLLCMKDWAAEVARAQSLAELGHVTQQPLRAAINDENGETSSCAAGRVD